MSADWDIKETWMRAAGAVRASWSSDGSLSTLELGPKPSAPSDPDEIKHTNSDEHESRRRDQIRRIALGSSGALLERLSHER